MGRVLAATIASLGAYGLFVLALCGFLTAIGASPQNAVILVAGLHLLMLAGGILEYLARSRE